jgi:hypothetical protein
MEQLTAMRANTYAMNDMLMLEAILVTTRIEYNTEGKPCKRARTHRINIPANAVQGVVDFFSAFLDLEEITKQAKAEGV